MRKNDFLKNLLAVNDIALDKLRPQNQHLFYMPEFSGIMQHKNIVVICDSDCDGLSSARIWKEYRPCDTILPLSRTNRNPLEIAKNDPSNVIVCLDCGSSVDWSDVDKEIYVIDHHESQLTVVGVTYINPVMDFGHTTFCTGTFLYAMFSKLYGKNSVALQYAAIAGVADMTPLLGDNRAIVIAGLEEMNGDDKCDIVEELNAYDINDEVHIGFTIAPSINAPSRIGESELAFNAVVLGDAKSIKKLKSANTKRKTLVDKYYTEATVIKHTNCLVYIIDAPNLAIHGLIANKAASKEHTSVMCINGGMVSFRSRQNIDFDLFIESNPDIIIGGGHKQAAGGTINLPSSKLTPEIMNKFREILIERFQEFCLSYSMEEKAEYDVLVDGDEILKLREYSKEYKPYGMGFRQPIMGAYLKVYQIGRDLSKKTVDSGYAEIRLKSNKFVYYCVCYDVNKEINVGDEYLFYFEFINNRLNIKWIE